MNELTQSIQLTDQQERYVLAGYAAFVDEDVIYEEFRAAFPEAVNLFAEEIGETKVPPILKLAIRHLSPAHPKFDKERLGITFDALRREYLNSEEDVFMGQSRNRLEVMNEVRLKLMKHAEQNADEFVDCMKLIIEATKEARAEKMAFEKLAEVARFSVSPEDIASMLGKLPPHKQEEFTRAYATGAEHPEIFIERLTREVEAIESENEQDTTQSGQEVLPEVESNGQVQESGEGYEAYEPQAEPGTERDIQSTYVDSPPEHRDTVEYTQEQTDRDDIPV